MSKENEAYVFGNKFVLAVLACSGASELSNAEKYEFGEQLFGQAKDLNLVDSKEDFQNLLFLNISRDFHKQFASRLLKIRDRLNNDNEPKNKLGDYFFISAAIRLNQIGVEYYLNSNIGKEALTLNFEFIKYALALAKELGMDSPSVRLVVNKRSDAQEVLLSLNEWNNILTKTFAGSPSLRDRFKLVIRELIIAIPYVGRAIDVAIFGKQPS